MFNLVELIVGLLFLTGLGSILAFILIIANKKLYVFEDPKIEKIETLLPGSNCGACGLAGCRHFAENVVLGQVDPSICTGMQDKARKLISEILQVEINVVSKKVARLACAGGSHVARVRVHYEGLRSCLAAQLASGGGKGCAWGCLGFGDCVEACRFDALELNEHKLPVVLVDRCTACGDCVDACPRDLFSIVDETEKLWVNCKNQAFGDEALNECDVACTACERCVLDAPESVMKMENNLPKVIVHHNLTKEIIQRCPTGAIVWYDCHKNFVKGKEAKFVMK